MLASLQSFALLNALSAGFSGLCVLACHVVRLVLPEARTLAEVAWHKLAVHAACLVETAFFCLFDSWWEILFYIVLLHAFLTGCLATSCCCKHPWWECLKIFFSNCSPGGQGVPNFLWSRTCAVNTLAIVAMPSADTTCHFCASVLDSMPTAVTFLFTRWYAVYCIREAKLVLLTYSDLCGYLNKNASSLCRALSHFSAQSCQII